VTSEKEARESLEQLPGVKTIVIPNGVEIPNRLIHVPENGVLRLLYLGRLHPKKGIANLLSACKRLNDSSNTTWSLTLAGAGDPKYVETLRTRIEELKLGKQVQMVGAVDGEMKRNLFENSEIAVVPSHTENFGMVVAEALAHGVPVIASKGTPWVRVEEMGCGLWVDNDPESLSKAIERMSKMPLREMGQRGREWMEKEFSWESIVGMMVQIYRNLLEDRE
jgi:glycosyltransferase involved in cell wall biosynthesis